MNVHRTIQRIVVLSALTIVPAFSARAQMQMPAPSVVPVLSTSGQGEAKVTPDRASVMLNVQTRATTAAAAASENATRTRAVLDAVAKLGLSRDQLSTEGYTVYPEMQYDKNGASPRVSGYVVTNTVRAETKRPEQAGAIVDAALRGGCKYGQQPHVLCFIHRRGASSGRGRCRRERAR